MADDWPPPSIAIMKPCAYCGCENPDAAQHCVTCHAEFEANKPTDPAPTDSALTDPGATLVVVAKFGDLIHATLLKDELDAAGIAACIPEDMSATPFGHFMPLAQFTVRVAASDYDAAKEIHAANASLPAPEEEKD
jgi:hypothetical protein